MNSAWILSPQIVQSLADFIWPFSRISGFFAIAPVFSSAYVSVRVRVMLAIIITLSILPFLPVTNYPDPLSLNGVLTLIVQFIIGLTIGIIVQVAFNAVTIAGENIALTMGLGFAQLTDPVNGVSIPMISQFLTICVSMFFLSINGHLELIHALSESFSVVPIMQVFDLSSTSTIVYWAGKMFIGAIMISIPVVTCLLFVNIALGLMTRVAPQMNIFSIGFPLSIMLGFIFILLALPSIFSAFQSLVAESLKFVLELFG